MDLNTKELYQKQSRDIFKRIELSPSTDEKDFAAVLETVDSIPVNPIRKNVFLLLGTQFFNYQKYEYSFKCYEKVPLGLFNFFELMSYLDAAIITGQVQARKIIINYSIEKIIKEKRINLIDEFIRKLKSLGVKPEVIKNLQEEFVVLTGDSSYVGNEEINLVVRGKIKDLTEKIDFWKKDLKIINSIMQISNEDYKKLSPVTKDKIKFHCLNRFHRELITDIASFDWTRFVEFLLSIERAIGYEEVNRIIFDFNVPIDPVKILELKSMKAQNEKMEQVEKVMGEIGLSEDFSKSKRRSQTDTVVNISDIVHKIEKGLDRPMRELLKKVTEAEPTQALEYINYLDPTQTETILSELESEINIFDVEDEPAYIRDQVRKAYLYIKVSIAAREYARALKMMDYVISEFPLSSSELNSFVRLRHELKGKWKGI